MEQKKPVNMILNFILWTFIFVNCLIISYSHSRDLLDKVSVPSDATLDYDRQYTQQNHGIHEDKIRRKFLKNKNLVKRIVSINKESKNTIYVEGVPHIFEPKANRSRIKKHNKFEKDYLNLLAMKNYNYIYKRDTHWRTWREINETDGSKTTICYRCDNNIEKNCTECHSGGFWTMLNEPPPCPYEIFCIIDEGHICAANYSQFNKLKDVCSFTTTYNDLLRTCDNPIETRWSFTKNDNQKSGEKPAKSIICKDEETCELTTIYKISPEHIIFKIMNSSNNVIYSRVMKEGENNYICTKDCGNINNDSPTTNPNNKPDDVDVNWKKRKENPKNKSTPRVLIFPTNKIITNGLPWEEIQDDIRVG